jgi:hypothetical protein
MSTPYKYQRLTALQLPSKYAQEAHVACPLHCFLLSSGLLRCNTTMLRHGLNWSGMSICSILLVLRLRPSAAHDSEVLAIVWSGKALASVNGIYQNRKMQGAYQRIRLGWTMKWKLLTEFATRGKSESGQVR